MRTFLNSPRIIALLLHCVWRRKERRLLKHRDRSTHCPGGGLSVNTVCNNLTRTLVVS